MTDPHAALDATVREEWGRLVALLLARHRRLDLVEDALADAVESAARVWAERGVPHNPPAWLHTVASRRIVDRLRAETMHQRRMPLLVTDAERQVPAEVMADPGGLIEDELLRLVLMCAHPALAPEAASALALRLVVGVSTPDIARLFLVSESTMAARITRAKKKVVGAGIPFTVPSEEDLPGRLDTVAQIGYLAFTAGYAPGSGPDLLRAELAGSAIELVSVTDDLRGQDEPVLVALRALMGFQHSRREARVDAEGELVLLADQDRSLWHHDEIAAARDRLMSPALLGPMTVPAAAYALQARIAGEHALAPSTEATNWSRIVALYDLLLQVMPGPPTEVARAVAVAEAESPAAGLAALADLDWPGSHRLPAVRAELFARVGDPESARSSYDEALALCRNDAERTHLMERRSALGASR
ncbi:RNA polymerase subunit sigma-24 [Nocardioides sp. Soil797]|nr:RNA polymerase subunit sigma-24 [Nocardioides sp. Soil797]